MTESHLIWGIGSLSVLSVFLWTLAPDYRTRVRYTWLLLIVCWGLVLIPAKQPWTADVSIALAELVAVHLFTAILFRLVLHRINIPLIVTDIVVIAGYFVVVLTLLAH